jgi:hypothetical protein
LRSQRDVVRSESADPVDLLAGSRVRTADTSSP